MKRRSVLSAALVPVFFSAGCISPFTDSDEPLSGELECDDSDKPTPSVEQGVEQHGEYDSLGSARYPDPPEQWSEDTAERFVSEYETSYQQNSLAQRFEERLLEVTLTTQEQNLIISTGNRYTVSFDYMLMFDYIDDQGELVSTDAFPEAVVYSVGSTAVVRATSSHEFNITDEVLDDSPDSLEEGTVLECFDE